MNSETHNIKTLQWSKPGSLHLTMNIIKTLLGKIKMEHITFKLQRRNWFVALKVAMGSHLSTL